MFELIKLQKLFVKEQGLVESMLFGALYQVSKRRKLTKCKEHSLRILKIIMELPRGVYIYYTARIKSQIKKNDVNVIDMPPTVFF